MASPLVGESEKVFIAAAGAVVGLSLISVAGVTSSCIVLTVLALLALLLQRWRQVSSDVTAGTPKGYKPQDEPLGCTTHHHVKQAMAGGHQSLSAGAERREEEERTLCFTVNGVTQRVASPDPSLVLADYLRDTLGLTGTKVGCGEGGCGCCTCIATGADGVPHAINSCLRLLCACDGLAITTVEGLGSQEGGFSAAQQAIADGQGSQCGFCTPGWVVAMSALLAKRGLDPSARLSPEEIESSFDGNLCRCTGYRPILQAFKDRFGEEAAADIEEVASRSCHDVRTQAPCGRACDKVAKQIAGATARPAVLKARVVRPLRYSDSTSGLVYVRPATLEQLLHELATCPGAVMVAANTGMGVSKYYSPGGPTGLAPHGAAGQPPQRDATLVDVSEVAELKTAPAFDASTNTLSAGATVTIEALMAALQRAATASAAAAPAAKEIARHLRRVANTQVRAAATWAGNIVLAAQASALPSDVSLVLAAAGTTLEVTAPGVATTHLSVPDFLSSGGKVEGKAAVVVSCRIPLDATHAYADKVSQRHVNSHAIVNAAFFATISAGRFKQCAVVFGGILNSMYVPSKAAAQLVGCSVGDAAAMGRFIQALQREAIAKGLSTDPQNSPEYRLALLRSFVYKFFLRAQSSLPPALQSAVHNSLAAVADRPVSHGNQDVDVGDPTKAPVGTAMPKLTSRLQASGEAKYPSDHPKVAGELAGVFIDVAESVGTYVGVDLSAVRQALGVVDVVVAADILGKGANERANSNTTPSFLLKPGDTVPCAGAHVALVLADTLAHARFAAKLAVVKVTPPSFMDKSENLSSLTPHTLFRSSVSDLAAGNAGRMGLNVDCLDRATAVSFALHDEANDEEPPHWGFVEGRPVSAWRDAGSDEGKLMVSGEFKVGGQKHFYLETNAAYAFPTEDGKITVTCGTQNPAGTQKAIADCLGVGAHKVDVKMRRTGGAYGGKLFAATPSAVVAAVAANKLKRPVRLHNERADDMSSTGGRAGMQANWQVGVDPESGVISSMALDMTFDSGCTNGGIGDLGMALQWSDNCYRHDDFSAKGRISNSNRLGNTSCRAPGVLASVPLHEYAIQLTAEAIGMPPEKIREINMYKLGDTTPAVCGSVKLGANGVNWTVPSLWASAKEKWAVASRRDEITAFNQSNLWRKRGMSMLPVKYGIQLWYYKVSATIKIFPDGTVHVAHGGAECGQGINTKVAQGVAYALGCPLKDVTVGDLSSLESPNATLTGGSGTSEACVSAALDACAALKTTLEPFRSAGQWSEMVAAAAAAGVGLLATGWFNQKQDALFQYATQGVGCVEVEVDILTGELEIRRADILMDQGAPLNPDIDLGQVEGGFIMALGFFLTEEVLFDKQGAQTNLGTWQYKPPSAHDIPLNLNIEFLANEPNPSIHSVLGSKASAEPPMALGAAAFFAAREAICAARRDAGNTSSFELEAPLTVERIQQACLISESRFRLD